jgi:hypothetical protein
MSTDKQEQQAIDALVDTYSDAGSARVVLELAGFPRGRIPAFSNAMVFWHNVAADARNGMLPGGIRPILEQAAKQWPHNPAFAPYAPSAPPASSPSTAAAAPPKQAPAGPIRIFVSYAHADETYRERLETRLKGIARLLPIEFWHDRKMLAGTKLTKEIFAQMAVADVVLLLVSPDFMASDYCFSKEMAEALKKYEHNKGLPVPIIIRPESTWYGHQIGQHLALPTDGKAISKWSDADDAWEDVSRGLQALLTDLAQKRGLLPA